MSLTKEALMNQRMFDDEMFEELMADEEYLAWLAKKEQEAIQHMEANIK